MNVSRADDFMKNTFSHASCSYVTSIIQSVFNQQQAHARAFGRISEEVVKHYLNVHIAFFCLVFHVTLNSCNTKLKTYWVHWGSLDIQVAFQGNVLCFPKALEMWGEIKKL